MAKQGKRPTVRQQKLIVEFGENPKEWFVERDTPKELVIVHRDDKGRLLSFRKGA